MIKKPILFLINTLGRRILDKFQPTVIAVTGSVGKTTTKEAIYWVLKDQRKTLVSHGNLNSEWGVFLSLVGYEKTSDSLVRLRVGELLKAIRKGMRILRGSSYYDVVILEMAADHPGDIGYLTHYYRPDIAVLTNVGPSHLTNYPSLEAIAAEKGILVDSVREGGTAVLNADDPRVQHIGQDCEAKKIWYGLESGDLRATKVESRSDGISYALSLGGGNYPVTLPARGGGGLFASLAALGVVTALGLNLKKAVLALKSFEPPEGRLQVHKLSNFTLIDDSYNASPASMMVALDFLQSFPGRKLAILGEMRELGAYSDMGHREVGTRAKEVADKIIAVAEGGRLIAESAGKKATWVATAEEASKVAQSEIRNGDTVLVKASRGVQLDKVVEVLQSEDKRDSIRSKP